MSSSSSEGSNLPNVNFLSKSTQRLEDYDENNPPELLNKDHKCLINFFNKSLTNVPLHFIKTIIPVIRNNGPVDMDMYYEWLSYKSRKKCMDEIKKKFQNGKDYIIRKSRDTNKKKKKCILTTSCFFHLVMSCKDNYQGYLFEIIQLMLKFIVGKEQKRFMKELTKEKYCARCKKTKSKYNFRKINIEYRHCLSCVRENDPYRILINKDINSDDESNNDIVSRATKSIRKKRGLSDNADVEIDNVTLVESLMDISDDSEYTSSSNNSDDELSDLSDYYIHANSKDEKQSNSPKSISRYNLIKNNKNEIKHNDKDVIQDKKQDKVKNEVKSNSKNVIQDKVKVLTKKVKKNKRKKKKEKSNISNNSGGDNKKKSTKKENIKR